MDYIIICLGEEPYSEKPGDIRNPYLVQGQIDLVRSIKQQNKKNSESKIILIYFGGRPRLLSNVVDLVDATLIAFLPGPDAGKAITNILSGHINPTGRLPITYPKYPDNAGAPYYHAISDQCNTLQKTKTTKKNSFDYTYEPCEVQWPFGYGLNYFDIQYDKPKFISNSLSLSSSSSSSSPILWYTRPSSKSSSNDNNDYDDYDSVVTVAVNVTNKGLLKPNNQNNNTESSSITSHVILFFTFDESRHVTPEYKRLRCIEKIQLYINETKEVQCSISLKDIRFIGPDDETHDIIQPGLQFRIGIGPNANCRLSSSSSSNSSNNDDDSSLCTKDVVTVLVRNNEYYNGVCEAACNVWYRTGCDLTMNMDLDQCWELCTAVSNKPVTDYGPVPFVWDWNYVQCLETVETTIKNEPKQQQECKKFITFCRNIFVTDSISFPKEQRQQQQEELSFDYYGMVSCILVLWIWQRQIFKYLKEKSDKKKEKKDDESQ